MKNIILVIIMLISCLGFSQTTIFPTGRVGIGNTAPTNALSVTGSVDINGSISATSLTASAGQTYVATGGKLINGHYVGEVYGGGIVFYVDQTVQHGLIVTSADQSTSLAWSSNTTGATNATSTYNGVATGTGTGSGATGGNTYIVVNGENPDASQANYTCYNLSFNGQTDWYLPAIDELVKLFNARYEVNKAIGSNSVCENCGYWSSTEYSDTIALFYSFDESNVVYESKTSTKYVRAIRAF